MVVALIADVSNRNLCASSDMMQPDKAICKVPGSGGFYFASNPENEVGSQIPMPRQKINHLPLGARRAFQIGFRRGNARQCRDQNKSAEYSHPQGIFCPLCGHRQCTLPDCP